MSLFDTLGVGLSGLKVASAGISTTSHNVSNASVRGYTRREVDASTASPVRRGLVWLGSGARVDRISRVSDPFALDRLFANTSDAASARTESSALSGLERLFEPTSGPSLRQSVDGIFDAFQAATGDPSDSGLRRNVVRALDSFARTASTIGRSLEAGIADRESAISASIDQINADLAEVATLNEALMVAGGSLSAGDLADRRDAAIGRLADAIGASVHIERDGSATVRIGGHAAVSGLNARTVGVLDNGSGPQITLSVDAGAVVVQPDGGVIAGEFAARDRLSEWLSDLDTLASGLATALNTTHAAGFTTSGAAGGDLFVLPGSGSAASGLRVDSAVLADPGALAFATSASGLPGDAGNLEALIGLEDAATVAGGTAGAYATTIVARVGSDTSGAALRAEATEATLFDAEELYANLSSVDLDEEAVQLVQYQAAYQAAAKVIQITDDTLEALMSIA